MKIKLTDEQAQQYLEGNPVTIVNETKTMWEPRGGGYALEADGNIEPFCYSFTPNRKFGTEFKTNLLAEQYLPRYKKQNLILNWLSEQQDQTEGNYAPYKSYLGDYTVSVIKYPYVGQIMMSKQNANILCDLLNNGTIDFDQ